MKRPPHGLSLPCSFVRARDGDTIEVCFPGSDRIWAIRLIDAWCPEVRGPERERGLAAKEFAEKCLDNAAASLSVHIPAPTDPVHLLGALTFDRIPGYIYLTDTDTLNGVLVKHGHATREKKTP